MHPNALNFLGLGFDGIETRRLPEAREDIEEQVSARRVIADGGVFSQKIRRGNLLDVRVIRVRRFRAARNRSTFSAVARMTRSRSSVARTTPWKPIAVAPMRT
jgi:hypothetical protein